MTHQFPFEHFLKPDPSQTNNIIETITKTDTYKQENTNPSPSHEDFSREELQSIALEVQNYLKNMIGPQKYTAYFEDTFILSHLTSGAAQFSTTTPFIKTMIESHHLGNVREALKNVLGRDYHVIIGLINANGPEFEGNLLETGGEKTKVSGKPTFTLDLMPTSEDLRSSAESKYIDHMNPDQKGILIDESKTFDSFIIGPSNNLACATAGAVAQNPGKSGKYPSLYIHSDSGLGKTHLLHAVANEIREHFPTLVITLVTAREFMTEMITSIQNNKITDFRKKYSEKIDVLMIDDIHELKNKEGTQNEFFHIFNELHNKGKQLIFTSDKAPQKIDGIAERIKTRLQWGLVIDIQRPDLETRIAILKRKAYELDLYLPDDILNLIACSIKASIRELEGSLIKLSAFADVTKVEIDTEMVKDLLKLKSESEENLVTLESISKAASQYFKIPLADLKSKARNKEITRARHIAMYLSRKIIRSTQQEIGKFYGGRDHSSVIHAVRTISNKLKTDGELSKDVLYLETNL